MNLDERVRTLERELISLRREVSRMREEMNAAGQKSKALIEAARSGNPVKILESLKTL